MIAINSHKFISCIASKYRQFAVCIVKRVRQLSKKNKKKIKMYSPECVVTISNLILSSLILIKHS